MKTKLIWITCLWIIFHARRSVDATPSAEFAAMKLPWNEWFISGNE